MHPSPLWLPQRNLCALKWRLLLALASTVSSLMSWVGFTATFLASQSTTAVNPIPVYFLHSTLQFFPKTLRSFWYMYTRPVKPERLGLQQDQISALIVIHSLIHSWKKIEGLHPAQVWKLFFFFSEEYCMQQPATGCPVWDMGAL